MSAIEPLRLRGTSTLTWSSPSKSGCTPAKLTAADLPPMLATTAERVSYESESLNHLLTCDLFR